MPAKARRALVLVLGGALINACVSVPRTRADYVRDASQCSMVPQHIVCKCTGTLEAATREDNKGSICETSYSFCRGRVHDCVVVH